MAGIKLDQKDPEELQLLMDPYDEVIVLEDC